jgi:uncharacterized protein with HEPN domain
MLHDPRKSLEDMRRAVEFLPQVTAGRTLDEYRADELLRTLVERKFEIIGEALNRLTKSDATLAGQIPERRQIISFRNILIHGYDIVDEEVVWRIVQHDLPILKPRVEALLAAQNPPAGPES